MAMQMGLLEEPASNAAEDTALSGADERILEELLARHRIRPKSHKIALFGSGVASSWLRWIWNFGCGWPVRRRSNRARNLSGPPLMSRPALPKIIRLIGSIRRECVDHVIVLGEAHLRRLLQAYARYYNDLRTHRSLDKDTPFSRPVQRIGRITSPALVGGLHHQYVRV
jgi:Integrase core domain